MKSKMMKSKAPLPQTMPSTPKGGGEHKTARPAKGKQINTPRVKFAPPAPERKKQPKY